MRKFIVLFTFFVFNVIVAQKQQSIGFVENKGQIVDQKGNQNAQVKYLLNTKGLNVQLRQNGFSYDVYETKKIPLSIKEQRKAKRFSLPEKDTLRNSNYKLEYSYHRIDIDFVGCNNAVNLLSEGKSTDYDNYYNVASRPDGVLNVHKFQKVTYSEIYPNIDIVFFVPEDKSKPVEYNFIVKPGGKMADIQMKFSGTKSELIENKIKMKVRFGDMEETLPLSWTEHDKKEVGINYKKIDKNIYGFTTDENIEGKKVIIDPTPTRLWGTYYGGTNLENYTRTLNVDSNDNVISSGETYSNNNIATVGSFQSTNTTGSETACMIKFDSTGQRLWSTYVRNIIYATQILDIAVSNLNELYVVGYTWDQDGFANNITTPGSHKPLGSAFSREGFILKFDQNGQRIWGTFYGGTGFDEIRTISIDSNQDIIIAGSTYSTNGISTPGAYQAVNNNSIVDPLGFFAKFSPGGTLLYGSYFTVVINLSTIDNENKIYFAGQTNSVTPNISTPGAHQTSRIYVDGYLIKFDENWNRLWCTYYGGTNTSASSVSDFFDNIKGLGTDTLNNVYIAGVTDSMDGIATPGAHKFLNPNSVDGFIAKFDKNGVRQWGTYFGEDTIFNDNCQSGFVSGDGNIFIAGTTRNINLSTPNSFQPTNNGTDEGFITKFNTNGQLQWSTYYGGTFGDTIQNITCKGNNIYVSGESGSTTLGTPGTFVPVSNGGSDFFVAKFQDCLSAPVVNNVPNICIGDDIHLTASGGSNYSWTGPNSFSSNQQNPVVLNAGTSQSGQYSCTITGTGGCDGTVSTNVVVGDTTKPTPDTATLPTINGDCNTVVSTIPTATDNCAGIINGTTTNPLNYSLPGNYTITWNYNDGNGNVQTQTQSVVITAVSLPTVISPQKFCIQQNALISDIVITGTNIKYYDTLTAGNLLTNASVLQNATTYYASQTINGCESLRVPVLIQIQNTAAPTGANQSLCATQNPTISNIVINGTTIKWYSSSISTVVFSTTTPLIDGVTYYATQTVNGCESINRLPITISLITSLNATNYSTTICDDGNDGNEDVTLSDYNSFLISSTTGNTFTYYKSSNGAENQIASEQLSVNITLIAGLNTIYVRIDSSNGCYQIVKLQLTLVKEPIINIDDVVVLCENKRITVDAGSGFDSYSWSTGAATSSVTISEAGNYAVTVTQNHGSVVCSSTKNFAAVISNTPTITSIDVVDWTDNENSITVNLDSGSIGDYEYSIDGINFQDSAIFNGLLNGNYTVTVRDKNKCGQATQEVYLLNYMKFFTPNADGYHDNWYIKFSSLEPNFEVKIFDRFGKLLKVMNTTESWDGTFNKKSLPSDDYWFVVTRNDGRIHKGHFAIKR